MRLYLVIIAGLTLAACSVPQSKREQQTAEELLAAQQRTSQERQQRELAESRLHAEEARVSRWQLGAMAGGTMAATALIIGTILGSRARKDASS
jgi:hypothetical protein